MRNNLVFRSFTFCEECARPGLRLAPGFGNSEPAGGAIEQARTEFLLDPTDRLRRCRFRQSQFPRSAHERSFDTSISAMVDVE
jgi:hypothetical protein